MNCNKLQKSIAFLNYLKTSKQINQESYFSVHLSHFVRGATTKSKLPASDQLLPVWASVSRPGTGSRPCVWEPQRVFRRFVLPLFVESGLLGDSSCDWQGCFFLLLLWKSAAYWPAGSSVFSVSQRMNLHSPPASLCACFHSLVGTSLQTGGGEKRRGSVFMCVCVWVCVNK